jgi:hypothetical protein
MNGESLLEPANVSGQTEIVIGIKLTLKQTGSRMDDRYN